MPRFRFTVRRMMIAVAIVAVLLESWIVWRRYTLHRDKAALIAKTIPILQRRMAQLSPTQTARGTLLDFEDGKPSVPMNLANSRTMLARMEQLLRHYEYAARHPWLPTVSEPPEE